MSSLTSLCISLSTVGKQMKSAQLSLIDWEKEQKPVEDKAARVARTMQLLYAVEEVWSAERLLTPVTMDVIMQLRRILYPPNGVLPK